MAITGVPIGGKGTFTATPEPVGSSIMAGSVPTWSSSDPLVTLVPAADGLSVVADVSATDTSTSFVLTVSGTSSNGSAITGTATVPILPAVVVPATSFSIDQTA